MIFKKYRKRFFRKNPDRLDKVLFERIQVISGSQKTTQKLK